MQLIAHNQISGDVFDVHEDLGPGADLLARADQDFGAQDKFNRTLAERGAHLGASKINKNANSSVLFCDYFFDRLDSIENTFNGVMSGVNTREKLAIVPAFCASREHDSSRSYPPDSATTRTTLGCATSDA